MLVLALAMSVAAASVIVLYNYTVSSNPTSPDYYLAPGPNYAAATTLGLAFAPSSSTGIAAGATIYLNSTSGAYRTYLLNVLEIKNVSGSTSLHASAYLNGTLPSNVFLYYSSSPINATYSAGSYSLSGTNYTLGLAIPITGTVVYFAFIVTPITAATSGTIYLSFFLH